MQDVCHMLLQPWTNVLGQLYSSNAFQNTPNQHSRATNNAPPKYFTPPHGQCGNRQATISLIFQHCIGWGTGEGLMIL